MSRGSTHTCVVPERNPRGRGKASARGVAARYGQVARATCKETGGSGRPHGICTQTPAYRRVGAPSRTERNTFSRPAAYHHFGLTHSTFDQLSRGKVTTREGGRSGL